MFYAELRILCIKHRPSSLNPHLLFELKIKTIDGKGLDLNTRKSNQLELYRSVGTLCLWTRIIHSVLIETDDT